jgi:hypothetical protein
MKYKLFSNYDLRIVVDNLRFAICWLQIICQTEIFYMDICAGFAP